MARGIKLLHNAFCLLFILTRKKNDLIKETRDMLLRCHNQNILFGLQIFQTTKSLVFHNQIITRYNKAFLD